MTKYIYEPKGRAAEYAELALNTHTGCPHACGYCYVREKFGFRNLNCTPRKKLLETVHKEALALLGAGEQREILLSFFCDPYPYRDPTPWTRQVLEELLSAGMNIGILSKGGCSSLADLELLVAHAGQVRFGASLTCWQEGTRKEWEPGAAPVAERVLALRQAHDADLRTWASLEPIIHCAETIEAIKASAGSVDQYNIGWLNYTGHKPNEEELPLVVESALRTGAVVGLKRDAHRILVRLARQDLIGRCKILF